LVVCPRSGHPVDNARGRPCIRCNAQASAEAWFWCGARPVEDVDRTVDETEGDDSAAASHAPSTVGRIPGYALEAQIGAGGGGVVHRARAQDGRVVALKILGERGPSAERQRQRFAREVAALRRLDLPGVMQVLDSGTTADSLPWYAMPLIQGPSLARVLADRPTLPPAEAARIIEGVARALHRLHSVGHAHRDVKPGNILLSTKGEPVLSDFGLVLELDNTDRITRTGQMLGTPRYMPIEQVTGRVTDWPRADIYALGVVLAETLGTRRERNLETPLSLPEGTPGALQWIVQQATAPLPSGRYRTALAMAEDLAAWRVGGGLGPRWASRTRQRVRHAVRSRPGLSVALALTAGAVLLGASVAGWSSWRAQVGASRAAAAWEDTRSAVELLRSTGKEDQAARRLDAFLQAPDHQGTAALSEAWLVVSDERRAVRDTAGRRAALGQALRSQPEGRVSPPALERLIALYRDTEDWSALSVLVESLALDDPELRIQLASAHAELDRVLPRLAPEDRAVLAPLRLARPLGRLAEMVVDADHDGEDEYVRQTEPDGSRGLWQGHPDFVARQTDDGWVLQERVGRAPVVTLDSYPKGMVETAQGRRFIFAHRTVQEVVDGQLVALSIDRPALNTYPSRMLAADLDDDGVDELVVSQGPPSGFLVEVFEVEGGVLRRAGWFRGGHYDALAALEGPGGTRLAALHIPRQRAAPFFGDEAPAGGPVRLDLFSYGPQGLVRDRSDVLGPTLDCVRVPSALTPADLDGDGIQELVAGFARGFCGLKQTHIFRQDGPDDLRRAGWIGGYVALAATQADDDEADELLVMHGEPGDYSASLLGVGDTPLESIRRHPPVRSEGPDWFTALGLHAAAAGAWEAAARADPSAATASLERAAASWEAEGRTDEAAFSAARAARLTPEDAGVRSRAVDRAIDALDGALGLSLLGPDSDDWRHAWLEGLAEPSMVESFDATLDAHWVVPEPLAVSVQKGRAHLTLASGTGTVLALPLQRVGSGPVGVRLTGALTRAEWGSGLRVELRPANQADGGLEGLVGGDAGSWHRWRHGRTSGGCHVRLDDTTASGTDPLDLWLLTAVDGTPRCSLKLGDDADRRGIGPPVATAQQWTLTLSAQGVRSQLARVQLDELALFGLVPMPSPALAAAVATIQPENPVELGPWVRLDPTVVQQLAADAGAEAAARAFADAWAGNAAGHPDDPEVRSVLLHQPDLRGVSDDNRVWLLLARADAQWAYGHRAVARDSLQAARQAAEKTTSWRARARVEVVGARWAAEEGRQEEAQAAVAAVRTVSPDSGLADAVFRAWAPELLPQK